MMTEHSPTLEVFGGVDTHSLTHHAAVVDTLGRELGDHEFPATVAGYEALKDWLVGFGELVKVGEYLRVWEPPSIAFQSHLYCR